MNPNYFIADVHLKDDSAGTAECFVNFCRAMAAKQARLYILGDLFDAWLGDDMMGELETKVLQAIKSISAAGGRAFFQPGNRDFLAGAGFAAAGGCELLPEHKIIELNGRRVFLDHGDALCVNDKHFQQQRRMVHSAEWQRQFLAKSPQERLELRRQYFSESQSHIKSSAADNLTMSLDYAVELLSKHKLDVMVYGHLHKPSCQELSIQDKQRRLFCLGDWGNEDSIWFVTDEGGADGDSANEANAANGELALYRLAMEEFLAQPEAATLQRAVRVS